MRKVIIDPVFFSLENESSRGLLGSLKKLQSFGFKIETDMDSFNLNETMKKICALEQIELSPITDTPATNICEVKNVFHITSRAQPAIEKARVIVAAQGSEIPDIESAANCIVQNMRTAVIQRKTKESDITVKLNLDGPPEYQINTGLNFFDHMLEQIAKHANLNLCIHSEGDLYVDEHHTVEDVGITLGTAMREALGDKRGISRYGFCIPMDESFAKCSIDLGGRNFLNFKCKFKRERVGDFPTELTVEFFRALAGGLQANLYLRAKGENDHHKIEALFKVFAKAFNEACKYDQRNIGTLPTTKGVL